MRPESLLDDLPVSLPDVKARIGFDVGIALKGLACQSSGDPFSFSSIKDLPPNVLWVIDIGQNDFFIKIPQNRGFAHRDFFGEPISVIAARYCIDFSSSRSFRNNLLVLSRALAGILIATDNIASLVRLPLESIPISLSQWVQQSLIDFNGYESSQLIGDMFLRDAIKTVVNMPAVSAPNQHSRADEISYYLGCSRLEMLDDLCDLRVPCGSWSDFFVGNENISIREKIEIILLHGCPALAQVVIHSPSKILSKITRGSLRSGSKRWVTEVDLVLLSQLSAISILQVRVCERYVSLGSALAKPFRPLVSLERSSVSYHVAAGAIAQAVATPASHGGAYFATSRMAWVASRLRSRVINCYLDSDFPLQGEMESCDIGGIVWRPDIFSADTFATTAFSVSSFDVQKKAPDKDIHVFR